MTDDAGFDDPVPALRQRLDDLRSELRRVINGLDDPQGQALLEVSAEVLGGLVNAFDDYQQKAEPVWLKVAKRLFP